MPYSIAWNENHCLVEFSGDIKIRDVELANKYCHGDKRLYKLSASIWDFSKCTSINIKPGELHYTSVIDLGSTGDIKKHKVALVVNNSAASEVIQEYITNSNKYGTPWEIVIFESLDGVEEWLFS